METVIGASAVDMNRLELLVPTHKGNQTMYTWIGENTDWRLTWDNFDSKQTCIK